MIKHVLVLLALSILAIIWMKEIVQLLNYLLAGYAYLSKSLASVIVGGKIVTLLRQAIVFVAVPTIITFVPALIYWLIRRSQMPHIYGVYYASWFITLTAIALYR